jgi:hypothetical protein
MGKIERSTQCAQELHFQCEGARAEVEASLFEQSNSVGIDGIRRPHHPLEAESRMGEAFGAANPASASSGVFEGATGTCPFACAGLSGTEAEEEVAGLDLSKGRAEGLLSAAELGDSFLISEGGVRDLTGGDAVHRGLTALGEGKAHAEVVGQDRRGDALTCLNLVLEGNRDVLVQASATRRVQLVMDGFADEGVSEVIPTRTDGGDDAAFDSLVEQFKRIADC